MAIQFNASAEAGAKVVADFLISPEAQARKQDPRVWGDLTVLAVAGLPADAKAAFDALPRGIATLSPTELGPTLRAASVLDGADRDRMAAPVRRWELSSWPNSAAIEGHSGSAPDHAWRDDRPCPGRAPRDGVAQLGLLPRTWRHRGEPGALGRTSGLAGHRTRYTSRGMGRVFLDLISVVIVVLFLAAAEGTAFLRISRRLISPLLSIPTPRWPSGWLS